MLKYGMNIVLKNCRVHDGTGFLWEEVEVLVEGQFIAGVGRGLKGDIVVDGGGLVLAPGFIDAHGHSDISIIAAPEATGKISQGITSEITSNCGLSPFPLTDRNREHLNELYRNYGIDLSWSGFSEYADAVDACRPAINIAPQCGHNTLRGAVSGYHDTPPDIEAMAELLEQQLREGAAGFSTGLLYTPGCFASPEEVTRLLKALSGFNRLYTTHLRSEGKQLIESVKEAISSCLSAGQRHLHISHLKTAGRANWGKIDEVFELIEHSPLKISADRYPYIESLTQLAIILPDELADLPNEELSARLRSPENFQSALNYLRELPPERWQTCRLVNTAATAFADCRGKIMAELPDPPLACAEILRDDPAGAMAAFQGMCRENLQKILTRPFTVCGSDESARPLDYRFGVSHPRGFGSFPEFFRFYEPEEAIRRMTSAAAELFGLKRRGRIQTGYYADLVLFDPDHYHARADFADPHRTSTGIAMVMVNGTFSYGAACPLPPKRGGIVIRA